MKKVCEWFLIIVIVLSVLSCSSLIFVFGRNGKIKDNFSDVNDLQIEQTIDWSNVTISCIGDSITLNGALDNPYPKTLKSLLGARAVYNYGSNGSTCAVVSGVDSHPICQRFGQISSKSDIILVMCGANDFGNNVEIGSIDNFDTSTYYGALNTLVSGLIDKYKNSFIIFMTCFDYKGTRGCNFEPYTRTSVMSICDKYNILCFDTFAELEFDDSKDTYDDLHPNQAFVTNVWVPAIAQYIKSNYKPQSN